MKNRRQLVVGVVVAAFTLALTAVVTADFYPLPPAPNGACVFKNGSCQIAPENLCKRAKGTWLGPDTTCP